MNVDEKALLLEREWGRRERGGYTFYYQISSTYRYFLDSLGTTFVVKKKMEGLLSKFYVLFLMVRKEKNGNWDKENHKKVGVS